MDIKVSLTIQDLSQQELALKTSQRGVAIAYDGEGSAHVEAYGFEPSDAGVAALLEMMREIGEAIGAELGVPSRETAIEELMKTGLTRPEAEAAADTAIKQFGLKEAPRLDHNELDAQCKLNKDKERNPFRKYSAAARCPVCRPVRPRFNPQPIGQPTK